MSIQPPVGELAPTPGSGTLLPPARWRSFRFARTEGVVIFRQSKLALVGVGIIIVVVLFCFVGPLLYRTNQVGTNLPQADLAPGKGHPLGTTPVGYDVLGRLMVGGQSSIELGAGGRGAQHADRYGVGSGRGLYRRDRRRRHHADRRLRCWRFPH